jgi:hypothetical protein
VAEVRPATAVRRTVVSVPQAFVGSNGEEKMRAEPGRIYAEIENGAVRWVFTSEQLPEWNEKQISVVDVTDFDPPVREHDRLQSGKHTPASEIPEVKKRIIDDDRDVKRFDLVTFKGHRFQADRESLWMLTFQVNDLNAGGVLEEDFVWWDIDNVAVPMSATDVFELHHQIRNRNYQAMRAARAQKDVLATELAQRE